MRRWQTIACNEPLHIGEKLSGPRGPFKVVREIAREEYLQDLQLRREADRRRGLKNLQGVFNEETKEWRPGPDVPADFLYCYVIEKI